jgi:threonylcarbamoyladenosine tRNA methylthiotransferase MtaB
VRDNTLAAKLPGHLPAPVKKERSAILHQISNEKKTNFYHENKGKIYHVLFESSNNKGYIYGFTENYIRVKAPFAKNLVNQIVPVKLDRIDEEGVYETLLS